MSYQKHSVTGSPREVPGMLQLIGAARHSALQELNVEEVAHAGGAGTSGVSWAGTLEIQRETPSSCSVSEHPRKVLNSQPAGKEGYLHGPYPFCR